MDELKLQGEIESKLSNIIQTYKDDPSVDFEIKTKLLNLRSNELNRPNSPSYPLSNQGLLTTQASPFFPNFQQTYLDPLIPLPSQTSPIKASNSSHYNVKFNTSTPNFNFFHTKNEPNNFKNEINSVSYDNNFSILPSPDLPSPLSNGGLLNLDQSLTFRKISSTGISSQLSQQISMLLVELKKLRQANSQLTEELESQKLELNDTKNALSLTQNQLHSASNHGKLAELVDQVYKSQKARDLAVVERLNLANQERDAAVTKANYLQQKILGSQYKDDVTTAILKSQSLENLKQNANNFVELVKEEKERKRVANEQEVETILYERDLIFKQKEDLERENKLLMDKLNKEFSIRKNMLEKQKITEKEKNECQRKLGETSGELENLKVCYSLHESLSKEKELHDHYNVMMDSLQDDLRNKNKQVRTLTEDLENLMKKIAKFTEDNKNLRNHCGELEDQLEEEKKQTEQLTRLISVLRKKLASL